MNVKKSELSKLPLVTLGALVFTDKEPGAWSQPACPKLWFSMTPADPGEALEKKVLPEKCISASIHTKEAQEGCLLHARPLRHIPQIILSPDPFAQ